ncbi:hypothetical protein [Mesonia sp.]|nr:hypothetical protein [Mesonia sp.]
MMMNTSQNPTTQAENLEENSKTNYTSSIAVILMVLLTIATIYLLPA